MSSRLVRIGTGLAVVGAVHSVLNADLLRRPRPTSASSRPVAVLVPARDEAGRLAACVRSALAADGVAGVVVLDDQSTDGSAAIGAGAGARVITGKPPPDGWLGKAWACEQLRLQTRDPVLVFVDADVRLEPGAVRAAVALLEKSGLDVICPFPRQLTGSLAERVVQPLLLWSWLTLLPLRLAERSPRPSLTAACGQFVVVRSAALERIGGFGAVRGDVLDDLALIRAIKAAGGRGGVVDGSRLASCRMYSGVADLRAGYAKSLWAAFGSPARAGAALAGLGLVYVLPPLAMLAGSGVGAVGYAAAVGSRLVADRVSRNPHPIDAFAHPVSIVTLAALTLDSLRQRHRGTLTWRGRPLADARPRRGRVRHLPGSTARRRPRASPGRS